MTDQPPRELRYPFFGVPPAKVPRPAMDEPTLRGKRVILSTPEGFVYDIRASSERYRDGPTPTVDVVTEEDWYRWMFTRAEPRRESFPIHLVWVEG